MSKDYITIKVKKNNYKSLLLEVLKLFSQLDYNVKVEEKWVNLNMNYIYQK